MENIKTNKHSPPLMTANWLLGDYGSNGIIKVMFLTVPVAINKRELHAPLSLTLSLTLGREDK